MHGLTRSANFITGLRRARDVPELAGRGGAQSLTSPQTHLPQKNLFSYVPPKTHILQNKVPTPRRTGFRPKPQFPPKPPFLPKHNFLPYTNFNPKPICLLPPLPPPQKYVSSQGPNFLQKPIFSKSLSSSQSPFSFC